MNARPGDDPFDLQRFLDAQAGIFETALAELSRGRKASHWMWFVFPQLAALGRSGTARRYGLSGLPEATAYLDHPVLGARLIRAAGVVAGLDAGSAHQVFGSPDDLKFRSCMTLFAAARPDEPVFAANLGRYYGGEPDPLTLALLGGSPA